jgi:hypothetical protein
MQIYAATLARRDEQQAYSLCLGRSEGESHNGLGSGEERKEAGSELHD